MSRTVYYDVSGNEIYNDAPPLAAKLMIATEGE